MTLRHASVALSLSLAIGCGVETAPPPVGDVGDTSGDELKVACNLARADILASVQGGRRTAIERGFTWYDAQVPYSQSAQYGGYRTDCSGFVSMCWETGTSYTTADFINDSSEWTSLGFDAMQPADAMVYRVGNSGHIMMFLGWNDAAKTEACVLEQASTADDMQFRARTIDSLQASGYHAIQATKLGGSTPGGADNPQCFCDAECSQYGDCCASCQNGSGGTSGSGGSGGSSGSAGSSGSGGSAGGSQCYCDSSCAAYGDCCASCPGGSGGSGSGGAGGSAGGGQCYCDSSCAAYGDCCASCPGGSGGSGSGGAGGGQCYCDAACAAYGDCCANCP